MRSWVRMIFKVPCCFLHIRTLILLRFCPQEVDKPVKSTLDTEDLNMKEYKDYLTLEESILKGLDLTPGYLITHT